MLKFIILAENSYMVDEWVEIVKRLDDTDKKIVEKNEIDFKRKWKG